MNLNNVNLKKELYVISSKTKTQTQNISFNHNHSNEKT